MFGLWLIDSSSKNDWQQFGKKSEKEPLPVFLLEKLARNFWKKKTF